MTLPVFVLCLIVLAILAAALKAGRGIVLLVLSPVFLITLLLLVKVISG